MMFSQLLGEKFQKIDKWLKNNHVRTQNDIAIVMTETKKTDRQNNGKTNKTVFKKNAKKRKMCDLNGTVSLFFLCVILPPQNPSYKCYFFPPLHLFTKLWSISNCRQNTYPSSAEPILIVKFKWWRRRRGKIYKL